MSYLAQALAKAATNCKPLPPDQEEARIRLQYFLSHPVADRVPNHEWVLWRKRLYTGESN